MAFTWLSIVHAVAAVFTIIELGLTAYGMSHLCRHVEVRGDGNANSLTTDASAYDGFFYSNSPPVINFMVFVSVWTLLILAYVGITPIYMTGFFHRLAALVLLVITTIFWFAGAIALAVAVGGPWSCGANRVCGTEEAAVAFAFFIW